jgi:hypothetical protein
MQGVKVGIRYAATGSDTEETDTGSTPIGKTLVIATIDKIYKASGLTLEVL